MATYIHAQKPISESLKTELESAEAKMFQNLTYTNAISYFKTDVSEDYFTIGADGVASNRDELLADTARLKMLEKADFKFYDKKIRVFGKVGIINGRLQAFFNGTYVAEYLYTAIFVRKNGKWMYTGWQGTKSKASPSPPVSVKKGE
ncbi:MAG: nuclear transport factor 2 family protein [Bacteroidota bacterium]|nr:nuclear transport factor 2 family protein [Bacteroidota bacterium]